MANQAEIQNRVYDIIQDLEKGKRNSDIAVNYSKYWDVSERTVHRYIALAVDIMTNKLTYEDNLVRAARAKIITEQAEEKILSNLELEAALLSIIEADLEVQSVISRHTDNGLIKTVVKKKPTRREIIKAIDTLWKMRGLYRPPQKEVVKMYDVTLDTKMDDKKIESTPPVQEPIQQITDKKEEK